MAKSIHEIELEKLAQLSSLSFGAIRPMDAGEYSMEAILNEGFRLKASHRVSGFNLELRARNKSEKEMLVKKFTSFGSQKALRRDFTFLPTPWVGRNAKVQLPIKAEDRILQLLSLIKKNSPSVLDSNDKFLLTPRS